MLILIDDIGDFGIGAYGAESVASTQGHFDDTPIHTPNIDRLAATGVSCDQAYVYPICEPTRVALMTGMHNGRNYIATKALHESQITFGDVFQRAGYATGLYGKWKQTRGTPEVSGHEYIARFGWDEHLAFDVTNNARGWNRHLDPTLFDNGEEIVYRDKNPTNPATGRRWFGPDLVNDAALDFIDRHHDEPFFLYYSMLLVHDEHTPTPDTQPASTYDNFDTNVKTEFGHMKGDDRRYFPDMLGYTDKLIGKLVDKLEEHSLRENTLVIVMGDNGAKASFRFTAEDGTVRQGGKGHNRDKGEHVPLIFSWPGTVPVGKHDALRAYTGVFDVTDLYPTLIAACGLETPNPDKIDGVNAWPQILGDRAEPHRTALYKWANGNRPMSDLSGKIEFAHNAEFKRYAPHGPFEDGRFFDLRHDLDEEAGEKGFKAGWENFYYTGLDPTKLTDEQRRAYDMLGEVLADNTYVSVESLKITGAPASAVAGTAFDVACRITPAHATRNNVVWESSDPTVATIDKFGTVTALTEGTVTINVYSWDDATPVADNSPVAYRRDGVSDSTQIRVTP